MLALLSAQLSPTAAITASVATVAAACVYAFGVDVVELLLLAIVPVLVSAACAAVSWLPSLLYFVVVVCLW